MAAYTKSTDYSYRQKWTAQVILSVWRFSRSLWSYRNTVVNGATDHEIATKICGTLDDHTRDESTLRCKQNALRCQFFS